MHVSHEIVAYANCSQLEQVITAHPMSIRFGLVQFLLTTVAGPGESSGARETQGKRAHLDTFYKITCHKCIGFNYVLLISYSKLILTGEPTYPQFQPALQYCH